ncbi:MAG: hypothetical protein ACOYVD_14005 [Bacillota bacterium]
MTFAHWLYIIGVFVVIATMFIRRNVVIPCVLFTFLIGLYWHGSLIGALNTVFNASFTAGTGLFNIFLIIGCMVALLKAISREGADQLMVKPLKGIMSTPLISYVVIIIATSIISLFFWPTPAAPLLGALLIPVAIRVGLPPMLCAIAIALAGQGMTLASDAIIQGAPGLTAKAAGVPIELVTYKGTVLALISGIIAIVLAWIFNKKDIDNFDVEAYLKENAILTTEEEAKTGEYKKGKLLAWIMSLGFAFVVGSMVIFDIKGGDSSALLAGMAILVVCIGAVVSDGIKGLDSVADYVADGLVFAFKVMGPIIPIAGFFFMGSPESVTSILGEGAPGFLFDIGEKIGAVIPPTGFAAAFGLLILGAITGLDGSGFSGLPVVGTLGGAMAGGDPEVASTLGAIGQMGAIWFGGGTLVAWSSLVAVAGICGVSVLELVRRNMIPVLTGLFVSTVFAVLFFMQNKNETK